jgi:hypothetical protein
VAKWLLIALKVVILGSFWLTVPPLLIGILVESMVIIPLRTPLQETPVYPWIQCWALGLVFLKIWIRCIMVGAFGESEYRTRLERVMRMGFARINTWEIATGIIAPVIVFLCDFLFVPFFVARTIAAFYLDSYYAQTILVRFAPLTYLLSKIALVFTVKVYKYLVTVHDEIRDSTYLIRTELTNREVETTAT